MGFWKIYTHGTRSTITGIRQPGVVHDTTMTRPSPYCKHSTISSATIAAPLPCSSKQISFFLNVRAWFFNDSYTLTICFDILIHTCQYRCDIVPAWHLFYFVKWSMNQDFRIKSYVDFRFFKREQTNNPEHFKEGTFPSWLLSIKRLFN